MNDLLNQNVTRYSFGSNEKLADLDKERLKMNDLLNQIVTRYSFGSNKKLADDDEKQLKNVLNEPDQDKNSFFETCILNFVNIDLLRFLIEKMKINVNEIYITENEVKMPLLVYLLSIYKSNHYDEISKYFNASKSDGKALIKQYLTYFLQIGINIQVYDPFGTYIFVYAITTHDLDIIKLFLSRPDLEWNINKYISTCIDSKLKPESMLNIIYILIMHRRPDAAPIFENVVLMINRLNIDCNCIDILKYVYNSQIYILEYKWAEYFYNLWIKRLG